MKTKNRILSVVLIASAFLLFAAGCGKAATESGSGSAETESEEVALYEIETAYGMIHYPEKWKDQVRTESDDQSIRFYAAIDGKPEQLLFVLEFRNGEGTLIGSLNDENVYLAVPHPELDDSWSEAEKKTLFNMQDDVNTIVEVDLLPPVAGDEWGETYSIDSAIGALQFPQKWKDQIRTQATDTGVSFYGTVEGKPEQLLFTLEFGESSGHLIGTLNGEKISVVEEKLTFDDSWTEAQRQMMADMQDAVNTILEGLSTQSGFVSAAG